MNSVAVNTAKIIRQIFAERVGLLVLNGLPNFLFRFDQGIFVVRPSQEDGGRGEECRCYKTQQFFHKAPFAGVWRRKQARYFRIKYSWAAMAYSDFDIG